MKHTGLYISYVGFGELEKRGVINKVGIYKNGKQVRPLYGLKNLDEFQHYIQKQKAEGKLKLRVL